ncbi:ferric reductase-like transmembrane domain-containing protein [Candidatus Roizmanbacteria bacterium]|nr:ferric reductase-like transmembrane domain-containing protein [Candidatus Roizmanbacteria bacterium]
MSSLMKSLIKNIRFYVLLLSLSFSIIVYFWINLIINNESLRIIKLTQIYALTAMTFLYFALLCGPFCYTFRGFRYRAQYLKARRAIGVSAFYFALLHVLLAFFGQIGGFEGLKFLDIKYLFAISLSFTALIILSLMAATSFDFIIAKMTFVKWKLLHRFVYLAGIFVLIHSFLIGTHFQDLFEPIPLVFLGAIAFLLVLEARRIIVFLRRKFAKDKR